MRAPVDDAVALVDEALFIQLAECLAHGLGAALIHGEAAAIPVAGHAERLLLLNDAIAVLLFPRPDALQKRVAPEIVAGQALFLAQHLLDLDLRGNAGMVRAGHPQGGIALHTLIAREDVLQRCVERVAHVQLTRNIRGRHDNGKRLFVRIGFAGKIAAAHPHVINLFLDLFGVVDLRKLFHGSSSFKIAGAQKIAPKRTVPGRSKPRYHLNSTQTRDTLVSVTGEPGRPTPFRQAAPGRPSSPASERLAPTAFSLTSAGRLLLPFFAYGCKNYRLCSAVCQAFLSQRTTESAARLPSPTAAGI